MKLNVEMNEKISPLPSGLEKIIDILVTELCEILIKLIN